MAAGDDARAIFDLAAFGRQTGGDESLRAEIIQMFLEDCPMRVEEIRAAVAAGDAPALASSSHALKGSAAIEPQRTRVSCVREAKFLGGRIHDEITRGGEEGLIRAAKDRMKAAIDFGQKFSCIGSI